MSALNLRKELTGKQNGACPPGRASLCFIHRGEVIYILKAPSQILSVLTLSDGTLKLNVHISRELSPENELELLRLRRKEGWMVFAVSEDITETDIPTEPVETDQKTPSQRLHGVIAVYKKKLAEAKNKTVSPTEIKIFYENQIERLIEHYKQKIHELEN